MFVWRPSVQECGHGITLDCMARFEGSVRVAQRDAIAAGPLDLNVELRSHVVVIEVVGTHWLSGQDFLPEER